MVGGINIGNDGGQKLKIVNNKVIIANETIENIKREDLVFPYLNCLYSKKYCADRAIKNIAILNQSGDLPIAPLYV